MLKMFHLRQLQFILIIISCLLLSVTPTKTATTTNATKSITAKKGKASIFADVVTAGAPTVVSSIVIPGKYHAYTQHLPQSTYKKVHVSATATATHQHHHQMKQQQQQQQNQQQRQQRVDVAKPVALPSAKLNPIRNWFGIFNRNNAQATAHDTTTTTCNCRCGERNDESRIVGGQTAGVSEYPWMARLSYFNRFYCGGTLINDRYVLTAAHCVKGFMWFMIKVTFGEHDRCNDKERPETRFVLRAFSQKFSFSNFDNDIALLRLNDRVPITSFIRPICLPRAFERNDLFIGTKGMATGWGTLKEDGKPSCLLQEVEVPVLDNEHCVAQTNYTQKMITKNMMCAGYPGVGERDSCQGDSGGPLVRMRPDDKRFEQIGIVSWGNGCARPNYPGVYTRVTKYLDWIMENSKDGCFCDEDD
ncbi:venom protease-like [Rhagoletis pomonella]|uniref:venom protease-like n=1 Tax=Rhagoletis pomonella TaxID=28610 RepID=UPI001782FFFB|nr:venom protease-like [Rhagoletis pomonella]